MAVLGYPSRSCRVWRCWGTRVGAAVCGGAGIPVQELPCVAMLGGPVQELPCVAMPAGLSQIFFLVCEGGMRKRKRAHNCLLKSKLN